MTIPPTSRLALAALLAPLVGYSTGCATLASAHGSAVKNDEITARITALEGLVTGLSACSARGKAEDNGVFAVSARPDGTIAVDAAQWYGSADMKTCIGEVASAAKLPPWGGGSRSTDLPTRHAGDAGL